MLKKTKIALIIISFLSVGSFAYAASDPLFFNAQITIPGSNFIAGQEKRIADGTALLCDYIVAIYKYAITIVGIFAMLAVAIGGVMWLMAAGNQTRVSEGKAWITGGLLGLVLALGAFIVLATISSDLITCKIDTIRKIVPKELPAGLKQTTVYGEQGRKYHTVADHLDSSGQYYCCVIRGDLEASGLISDTRIVRCATYEAATAEIAQAKNDTQGNVVGGCNYFYSNYSTYGDERGILPLIIPLYSLYQHYFGNHTLRLEPQEGTSGGTNSATVYKGKCWEIESPINLKKLCVAYDDPDYCPTHDIGDTCRTTTGNWGYCDSNKTCQKCSQHCKPCTEDYQCPNQTLNPREAGEAGVICGNSVVSIGKNSGDCRVKAGSTTEQICDQEFGIDDIFTDECAP